MVEFIFIVLVMYEMIRGKTAHELKGRYTNAMITDLI